MSQLGLDGLVADELLGPGHLLDLEPDRVAVLEQQRDHRPDVDPAPLLERDDLGAELGPLALVGAQVADVVDG